MANQPTVIVEHIGGPYDGWRMPVPVDSDGNPPEFYVPTAFGPIDPSIDPSEGPVGPMVVLFYDLDIAFDDDGGLRYLYRFRGEDLQQAA